MSSRFKIVVLSGGGVKGLIELGAAHYYYEKKLYDPEIVHTYAGTSIGSVISLLLICGYTPMEIFKRVYTNEQFFHLGDCQSPWDILQRTGLMSINSFAEKIGHLVKEKMGSIPTLGQLQKQTGKTLIVAVANVTKLRVEYFSPQTHPNLNSLDAVKMSCNLPLIFQKISYNGDYYVDGGLMDGFPIHQVDDGLTPILGIVVSGTDCSLKDSSFFGYIYRLINMPINMITKLRHQNLGDNVTLIDIECENIPLLQFSMPSKEKMTMFLQGFQEAEAVELSEDLVVKGWPVGCESPNCEAHCEAPNCEDCETSGDGWDVDWDLCEGPKTSDVTLKS